MTEGRVSPAQHAVVDESATPQAEPAESTRTPIGAAVLADPAPLGLAGFGMAPGG
jgi:succinate-acetate transporter protein